MGRTHSSWRIRRLKTPKFLPESQPLLVRPEFKAREKQATEWVAVVPILFFQALSSAEPVQKLVVVLRGQCHQLSKAKG